MIVRPKTIVGLRTGALFVGLFLADVAGWMQLLTLSWLLLSGPDAAIWAPLVIGARTLPKYVVAPFAGALADRRDRLTLYQCSRLLAILPPLLLAAGATDLLPRMPAILLASTLGSMFAAIDGPTRRGLLWDIGGEQRVFGAVSLSTAAFQLAASLTPAIGVVLVGTLGSPGALVSAAGCAAAAAAALHAFARLSGRRPPRRCPDEGTHPLGGLRFLWHAPHCVLLLVLTAVPAFIGRGLAIAIPALADEHAHRSLVGVGALASAPGAGAFVAAVILAIIGDIADKSRFAVINGVICVVAVAVYFLPLPAISDTLALAIAGGSSAAFGATVVSLLHLRVPDHLRGRVFAL